MIFEEKLYDDAIVGIAFQILPPLPLVSAPATVICLFRSLFLTP